MPFVLKLTASTPLSAKPPAPLCLPFEAHFFPLADGADRPDVVGLEQSHAQRTPAPPPPESTPSTPYVASVDLSAHFASLPFPTPLPAFPGHAIPAAGQIQIVVSNPTMGNGVKVFVVPYDVRGMPAGHRMVLRQNLFEEQAGDGISGGQRKLRASAVLHICCVASKRPRLSSSSSPSADTKLSQSLPLSNRSDDAVAVVKYYLHSTIRLVFSTLPSATPGDGPAPPTCTRTVVDMGAPSHGPARFVPWADDDAAEYQALRQMRKVAIKRQGLPRGRAQQPPAFASPSSILGLRPPVEPSSLPMLRTAETYVLPPLARDENHDLLPSPSLRASPLPPARQDDASPPLAFAKVRSANQSGRSSPLPPAAEQSELSRRLRSLRVDQAGR